MEPAGRLGLGTRGGWHTDQRIMLDLGQWSVTIAGYLGKFGQDFTQIAQHGVNEVHLGEAGGSSAKPHKQDPVRAEILVALARIVVGHRGTLSRALVPEQERSGATWATDWLTFSEILKMTGVSQKNFISTTRPSHRLGTTL